MIRATFKMAIALAVAAAGIGAGQSLAQSAAPKPSSEVCQFITMAQVEGLFDRWNESLKTLDPSKVVANYTEDAVLLPTVSNVPRLTQAERRDYFEHFLAGKPVGKIDSRVIKIGCNTVTDAGLYTFTVNGGERIGARYTFVYGYQDGRWLITHHHSSKLPETVTAKAKAG